MNRLIVASYKKKRKKWVLEDDNDYDDGWIVELEAHKYCTYNARVGKTLGASPTKQGYIM